MFNLGIIGTNWITDRFISVAKITKKYQLHSVYSRTIEQAKKFASKYNNSKIKIYDRLAEFLADPRLDVVYIASPNSIHFSQAKLALTNGKNVIVEKPAFSTMAEMEQIITIANQRRCFFFEAARNFHEHSLQVIKEFLADRQIVGANFAYAKYSSRMDQFLSGDIPNIFSPQFSGGALMDLGVYLIYVSVALFGRPTSVHYLANLADNGIDLSGNGVLCYPDFQVTLFTGKNLDNFACSQIFLDNGTLVMDSINSIASAKFIARNKDKPEENLPISQVDNPMVEEAHDFAEVMLNPNSSKWGEKYEEWIEVARIVNEVMVTMRKSAGIVFAADQD